ncbi:MAG: carboxypeptidase regulatory-like domain-containing protein, partial [Chloroflexota bacterium]
MVLYKNCVIYHNNASVTVTKPMIVTVKDTDGTLKSGLKVYAFDGATYTNYSGTTNASGQAAFTLPIGNYRFRADLNGIQFWSAAANHCALPGCENADVIVSIPLTVTVQDAVGAPKTGVKLYAFNGATYTNYSATSDASGNAIFTLPLGSYRFRADYSNIQYWSGAVNHCAIPGCLALTMTVGPQMTATFTPTATFTSTALPPSATPTVTPAPTGTATPLPAATETLIPTATETPADTATPVAYQPGNET